LSTSSRTPAQIRRAGQAPSGTSPDLLIVRLGHALGLRQPRRQDPHELRRRRRPHVRPRIREAHYQRRKGRDLFDLRWAHEQADPDPARIVALLAEYQAAAGRPMIRARELRANLAAKRVPSFLEEVRPLLRPDVAYDPTAALDWVEAMFIPLLG
jgi:hypothetical protein